MKRLTLVLLVSTSMVSFASYASGHLQNNCSENSQSAVCQAYISGVVEGYIASMQKYLAKQAEFKSDYVNRVYASRVNSQRADSVKVPAACLPDNINTDEIIAQFSTINNKQELTNALGQYLRKHYPCK